MTKITTEGSIIYLKFSKVNLSTFKKDCKTTTNNIKYI